MRLFRDLFVAWVGFHPSTASAGWAAHQQPSPRPPTVYDRALFDALKWRNIGPNRGGRALTAAGSSKRPFEYYFGATGGGVWKTTDGGLNWRPVSDRDFRSSSVGSLAVCEADPDVVYVGMGETELRGNVIQGDGIYKTIDGGKSWTHLGLAETQAVARVRIDPRNCDLVYVAALGHPYGPNAERGVFRSKDGGTTWDKILYRDDRTGAIDLALDPAEPRIMYAGLWQVSRAPWGLFNGGPGSGLFKSSDGGDTWTEITRNPGLPAGVLGKVGVSVSGADPARVYAIVEADSG
ncbi:MAG: glycosyl hydrolase, partial [Gemmatimonadota bacterium]